MLRIPLNITLLFFINLQLFEANKKHRESVLDLQEKLESYEK